MPNYQIEVNGRRFEVEAPTREEAIRVANEFAVQPGPAADPLAGAPMLQEGRPAWPPPLLGELVGAPQQPPATEPGFTPVPMSGAGLPLPAMTPTLEQRNITTWSPWMQGARDFTMNVGQGAMEGIAAMLPAGSTPQNVPSPFSAIPESTAGQFGRTIGHFIPPAVTMGPGAFTVGNALRYGVAPGVVAEGMGQFGDEIDPATWGAYLRVAGGILGTGGAALTGHAGVGAGLPRSQAGGAQIIGRALRDAGVTPDELGLAENLMRQAGEVGVPLSWPEAFHAATNGRVDLTTLQRIVEQSRTGQPVMSEMLGARPPAIRRAVDAETAGLGPLTDPATLGPQIQRTMTERIQSIVDEINAITRPQYAAAEPLQVDAVSFGRLYRDPLFQQAIRDIRGDPVFSPLVAGQSDESIAMLHAVKQWLQERAATAAEATGRRAATTESRYSNLGEAVENTATRRSEDYADALVTQGQLRAERVAPLEQGVAGQLAGTADLGNQIRATFPANPLAGTEQQVRQAVGLVAERSPEAAQSLVRHHITQVFNEAAQNIQRGPNPYGGANFVAALQGNQQQLANLRAAFESAFPDGAERFAGFQRLMQILEATGRRQPLQSPTASNIAGGAQMERAGTPLGTMATTLPSTRALTVVSDWYRNFLATRTGRALAEILTDPASGDVLRRLARGGPWRDLTAIAAELFGQTPQLATDIDYRTSIANVLAGAPQLP